MTNNLKPLRHRLASFFFIATVLTAALLATLFRPPQVAADPTGRTVTQPNFWNAITNYNALTLTSSNKVFFGANTNTPITIRQNQGDSWIISVVGTNNTGNSASANGWVQVWWDVYDGSGTNNWTTTQPFTWGTGLNGTNTQINATNFDRAYVNNLQAIFPTAIEAFCSNSVTVNFLHETHGNQ